MERIDTLEAEVRNLNQSKETMGQAMVKVVKKVKKMERLLQRRKMVLSNSENEEAAHSPKQGRNLEVSLEEMVGEHEDRPEMFVTPTQSKSLGEAAAKDVSPGTLEAANILKQVSSGSDIGTYRRRSRESAEEPKDFFSAAKENVERSAAKLKGKQIQILEIETPKTKKQLREEEASLREIERLQAKDEAELARNKEQDARDAELAKRVQEELEMSQAQRERMEQVQEAARFTMMKIGM